MSGTPASKAQSVVIKMGRRSLQTLAKSRSGVHHGAEAQVRRDALLHSRSRRLYYRSWAKQPGRCLRLSSRTREGINCDRLHSQGADPMKSERDGINPAAKPSGTGCLECSAVGGWWLHLRRCVECGHIGCCDTSPNQHASKHNAATGHPIITSFEPGERWFYDYRTGEFFAGPRLHAPHSHPLDQPVPGPAEAVPSNWQTLLHE
jgi:hypothetical protein